MGSGHILRGSNIICILYIVQTVLYRLYCIDCTVQTVLYRLYCRAFQTCDMFQIILRGQHFLLNQRVRLCVLQGNWDPCACLAPSLLVWLIDSAPDLWGRGHGFESGIYHNDSDALQGHCLKMQNNLRVKRETYP